VTHAAEAAVSAVHRYRSRVTWSGSTGVGYQHYCRDHRAEVLAEDGTALTPTLDGAGLRLSGDAAFGGNGALLNTEQLLVLAASACQMLSFLAVCARARADVVHYLDEAVGEMPDEAGWITVVELRPMVTVRGEIRADRLQHWTEVAHRECYIASSLRTEVRVQPTFAAAP
jgi:organic hydroperoxide reductase OsmC/OhrA